MSMYYDRLGVPIDLHEWASLMEDPTYRIIAQTTVGDYAISTVWLGLNHNYFGGPPLIYETMVFGPDGWGDDEMQTRYATESEARITHEQIVQLVMLAEDTKERVDW